VAAVNRFEELVNKIGTAIAPGGDLTALSNPVALEFKALDWLANSDPANLPIDTTNKAILVERYTLSLLYFSTGGPSWGNKYNFLSSDTVCKWNNDGLNQAEPAGVFCNDGSPKNVNEISMRKYCCGCYEDICSQLVAHRYATR
jgi:hypothetical protein